MKTTISLKITAILLFVICSLSAKAQRNILFYTLMNEISVFPPNPLNTFQEKETYVVMNDPESEKMEPYIEVFKNYWTISKLTFIKKSEIQDYYSDGNIFITFDSRKTNSNGSSNVNYFNDFRISFWAFSKSGYEEMLKEKKKKNPSGKNELDEMYQHMLAQILLFPNMKTYANSDTLDFDFDGDGQFHNCGPGYLKNQILYITSLLKQNKELKIQDDQSKDHFLEYLPYYNFKELAKLKTATLYAPENILYTGKFLSTTEPIQKEEKLFKKYTYNYKILSTEALNQKILADTTAEFFYLMYGSNKSGYKYVWIVNSLTGEVAYSFFDDSMSRYMNSGNLKDINEKITKGK